MSRAVGGEFIFGPAEKEKFVGMMWKIADFLGIEVLDYVVMSNHYHQLVWVPGVVELSDRDLHCRLRSYYGVDSKEASIFEKALSMGGAALEIVRSGHLKRMGNISEFEKVLKQGFSVWYNKRNKRRGTLWMERFKSVLVEDSIDAREITAAYIDLNPVRAEMVEDPKNYRFCGYGAAMSGDGRCRLGIMRVVGIDDWENAAAVYRLKLVKRGHVQIAGKKGAIKRDLLLETLEQGGQMPQSELLRLRVRYFSDGLVLGSESFVEEIFEHYRGHFGEKRKSGARPIRALADSPLRVIRDLRLNPIS